MGAHGDNQPTITDDRGVERPLWHFPRELQNPDGHGTIDVNTQTSIESRLGVPPSHLVRKARAPIPQSPLARLAFALASTGCLGLALASPNIRWPLVTVAAGALIPAALPVRWLQSRAADAIAIAVFLSLLASLFIVINWHREPAQVLWSFTFGIGGAAGVLTLSVRRRAAMKSFDQEDPRTNPRKVRRVMLASGRCPSCASRLSEARNDAAVWSSCPSCDGLWIIASNSMGLTRPWRCPNCHYPLEDIPGDDDVQCPECGLKIPFISRNDGGADS